MRQFIFKNTNFTKGSTLSLYSKHLWQNLIVLNILEHLIWINEIFHIFHYINVCKFYYIHSFYTEIYFYSLETIVHYKTKCTTFYIYLHSIINQLKSKYITDNKTTMKSFLNY